MTALPLFEQPGEPPATPSESTAHVARAFCDQCGAELCVWHRGRRWCIVCDETELFGADAAGDDVAAAKQKDDGHAKT
jgi:hypothetical protein